MEWTTSNVPHRAKIRWNKENKWHKSITNQPIIHKYAAFTLIQTPTTTTTSTKWKKKSMEKKEKKLSHNMSSASRVCLSVMNAYMICLQLLMTPIYWILWWCPGYLYTFSAFFSIHFIFDWIKNERALLKMMSSTDDRWMPIAKVWTSTTELIFQFRTKSFFFEYSKIIYFFQVDFYFD